MLRIEPRGTKDLIACLRYLNLGETVMIQVTAKSRQDIFYVNTDDEP